MIGLGYSPSATNEVGISAKTSEIQPASLNSPVTAETRQPLQSQYQQGGKGGTHPEDS